MVFSCDLAFTATRKMHQIRFPLGLHPTPLEELIPNPQLAYIKGSTSKKNEKKGRAEKGRKVNEGKGGKGKKRKKEGEEKEQAWDWPRAPQSLNPALLPDSRPECCLLEIK